MQSMTIPAPVKEALRRLAEAGYEGYLVGGCVRDLLRGVSPHDYDMTTNALPEETLQVFSDYRTIETGLQHGTVTVLIEGMPLEITTYRRDGAYTDHRRPDTVEFTPSLIEDLARRDFTVNAMAYHPEHGLVDPYGGQTDLANGIIRAVGDPGERFAEDALRILRALRFSARFGFAIEEATAAAAEVAAPTLVAIAAERIREELYGILMADHAAEILTKHARIVATVMPEGVASPFLSKLPPVLFLRVSEFLLSCSVGEAEAVLRRLRADNRTVSAVSAILRLYDMDIAADHAFLCRLLRTFSCEVLDLAFSLRASHGMDDHNAVAEIGRIRDTGACYRLADLAIGGDDVAACSIPRGPRIGELLEMAYTAVIEGCVPNEREALMALIAEKTAM